MIEYKGKAPVNTRLNPIGPLEGKLSLAYYHSFVWATLVASGSVWVGRLKSPLAVKGLIEDILLVQIDICALQVHVSQSSRVPDHC